MSQTYLYVFAVAAPETTRDLEGLPGLEPGTTIRAVPVDGLAAVVCDVPADAYGEAGLRIRLADLEWVGQRGLAHERIVESCVLAGPAIPLRFGTIFRDAGGVEALLARHADRLREILADLGGKVEYGLRVHVDRARFDEWAARATGPASPGAGSSAGRAFLERKKAASEKSRRSAEALVRELVEIYVVHEAAAVRGRRREADREDAPPLEASFLVEAAGRASFEEASRAAAASVADRGFEVVLSGPWPPYAFVPPLEAEEEVRS